MSRKFHYTMLFIGLVVLTGCQTVNGAATGFNKDIHNVSNPDENGWNAIKKADAWMQKNMW